MVDFPLHLRSRLESRNITAEDKMNSQLIYDQSLHRNRQNYVQQYYGHVEALLEEEGWLGIAPIEETIDFGCLIKATSWTNRHELY